MRAKTKHSGGWGMRLDKKINKLFIAMCLVCFFSLIHSLGYTQPTQVVKLSCSQYLPTTHPISKITEEFCAEIEKRTTGRIKITYYGGGQLAGPTVMYDNVVSGVTDIGYSAVHYNRGRFPQSEALECPLGIGDNWIGAKVFTDFYEKYTPKEWDETHPLLFSSAAPAALQMGKKQIRTMKDLKGQVIRAAGRDSEAISALGGTSRVLEIGELYDNIAKGVVDGAKLSTETSKTFRLAEVCKYITFCPQISGASIFYLVMNKNKWNALPQDVKQTFTELSKQYSDKYAMAYNEADLAGKKFFLSFKGNEYYNLPSSEAAAWKKAVQPVIERYVDETTKKGFSRDQIRKNLDFVGERITHWTAKSNELKIQSILRE
jgi:TRAP-type transport system periplasmic protein